MSILRWLPILRWLLPAFVASNARTTRYVVLRQKGLGAALTLTTAAKQPASARATEGRLQGRSDSWPLHGGMMDPLWRTGRVERFARNLARVPQIISSRERTGAELGSPTPVLVARQHQPKKSRISAKRPQLGHGQAGGGGSVKQRAGYFSCSTRSLGRRRPRWPIYVHFRWRLPDQAGAHPPPTGPHQRRQCRARQ